MVGFLHENITWIGLIYYYSWYCYLKLIQIILLPLRLQRPVKTGLNLFCAVFVFSNLWLTVNQTMVLTEDRSILFVVFIGYGSVRLWFFSSFVTGLPNTISLCRIQVLILKNIPFWGNEHDSPFPHPHSTLVVISGLENHVATKASGGLDLRDGGFKSPPAPNPCHCLMSLSCMSVSFCSFYTQ